jgi:hypothetical protein
VSADQSIYPSIIRSINDLTVMLLLLLLLCCGFISLVTVAAALLVAVAWQLCWAQLDSRRCCPSCTA